MFPGFFYIHNSHILSIQSLCISIAVLAVFILRRQEIIIIQFYLE